MKKYKFELQAQKTKEAVDFNGTINDSAQAADFCRNFYFDDINIYESFFIVLIKGNRVIGWAKIAQGGVSCTTVDVKIIAKYAIDTLSTAVILCHNHPSGNLTPSKQDKTLTSKIVDALKLFDIQVNDHLIITDDSYLSFQEIGLI